MPVITCFVIPDAASCVLDSLLLSLSSQTNSEFSIALPNSYLRPVDNFDDDGIIRYDSNELQKSAYDVFKTISSDYYLFCNEHTLFTANTIECIRNLVFSTDCIMLNSYGIVDTYQHAYSMTEKPPLIGMAVSHQSIIETVKGHPVASWQAVSEVLYAKQKPRAVFCSDAACYYLPVQKQGGVPRHNSELSKSLNEIEKLKNEVQELEESYSFRAGNILLTPARFIRNKLARDEDVPSDSEQNITFDPSSLKMHPYYCFEEFMSKYEYEFQSYGNQVPAECQVAFLNEITQRLASDKLFPFHYENDRYNASIARIQQLLASCTPESILNNPSINMFHAFYWLSLKPNCFPIVVPQEKKFAVYIDANEVYSRSTFELVLHQIRENNGVFRILGFVKSPIYNFLSDPCDLYIVFDNGNKKKLDTFLSVHSYQQSRFTQTNRFYAFDYSCDVANIHTIKFEVKLGNYWYNTKFWFMPTAVFTNDLATSSYIRGNALFETDGKSISLNPIADSEIDTYERSLTQQRCKSFRSRSLRNTALTYKKTHRVWLYYDLYSVEKDNGFYQFQNDILHTSDDGIERYYVVSSEETYTKLKHENTQNLVRFGGYKHKLLYLSAERVFTAYYGLTPISPFQSDWAEREFADIIKFKTIYLQHGVLHAALHTYNSIERCRAEQIVVSSQFEVDNYIKNYHYRREDLLPTGMARYDYIDRSRTASNKILYAPSWRKYLTVTNTASSWTLDKSLFLDSDYYKNTMAFLSSPKLHDLLASNNFTLDVKLHPVIANDAKELFSIKSDRIRFTGSTVEIEDYKIFITDFSSFLFDFACLKRPILYFIPDYPQFLAGMNHYKSLDLDFKNAFGEVYTEAEEAIESLSKYFEDNFVLYEPYKSRLENFFVPLDSCREKLYQIIMEDSDSASVL